MNTLILSDSQSLGYFFIYICSPVHLNQKDLMSDLPAIHGIAAFFISISSSRGVF